MGLFLLGEYMPNSKIDDNFKPSIIAVSSSDGETIVRLEANPSTGALLVSGDLVPNRDYDYIDIQQTSDTVETYVYKLGGSGGTTIRTVVVTYTDGTKANLDTVEFS